MFSINKSFVKYENLIHRGLRANPKTSFVLRSAFLAFLIGVICCFSCALYAEADTQGQEQLELVQRIIKVKEYSDSLIKNIKCSVEFEENISPGVISEDQYLPVYRKRSLEYTYEPEGRIRISENLLSVKGLEMPADKKAIMTDNLKEEKIFDEFSGSSFLAIKSRTGFTHSLRKPTFFIEATEQPFSEMLKSALAEGKTISVKSVEGNPDYVELTIPRKLNDSEYEYVCMFDSKKLYFPLKIETYRDGKLIRRKASTPQKLEGDVWFPSEAQYESFGYDGEMLEKMVMKVNETQVNLPELDDSLFEVEMKRGMRIVDSRGSQPLQYVVGADIEADMMLEELALLASDGQYFDPGEDVRKKVKRVRPRSINIENETTNIVDSEAATIDVEEPEIDYDQASESNKVNWIYIFLGALVFVIIILLSLFLKCRSGKCEREG